MNPLNRLRHHVTGAIERGEAEAIVEQRPAMAFADLPFGAAFVFADPVGFSIGRQFRKISARKYVQVLAAGVHPSNPIETVYKAGTTEVKVRGL